MIPVKVLDTGIQFKYGLKQKKKIRGGNRDPNQMVNKVQITCS